MTKEKSQAELEIEALADVFGMATTGFKEFYETCEKNSKGTNSTSASSGNDSTSASSGNFSKSASSGNFSKSASSGDYSTSASSGNDSKSASSGDYSTSASSGNDSKSASSGNDSKSASSGNDSKSASSGNDSKSASSGDYSTSASSGNDSKSASSGNYSTSASSGDYSTSASSGDYSTSASSGNYSKSASSGDYSGAASIGYRAAVKGDVGNLLMASEYIIKDGKFIPVGGKADIVDGKNLKAGRWYIVQKAKWVEVDLSDGIFSYVLSNKNGVKKVKTENGKTLYVVSDENGNTAHGKTIAEARKDLVYKAVAKFDGKLPKSATGKEWVAIYRALTGACGAGVRDFVEQSGKSLDDTYTAEQIAKLANGKFGSDEFAKKVKELA